MQMNRQSFNSGLSDEDDGFKFESKKGVKTMKYIAAQPISNTCSICIKEADDEKVSFDIVSDKVLSKHKVKVYYNLKGCPFFKFGNVRYYLNEFIRTEF